MSGHMAQFLDKETYRLAGVKTYYASKPYFKKYHFKILYDFSTALTATATPMQSIYPSSAYMRSWAQHNQCRLLDKLIKNIVIDLHKTYPNIDIKHRSELGHLSIFVENFEDFVTIASNHTEQLVSVTIPINQKQIEMSTELGEKVVFKNKMFKNKFRYKLTCSASVEFISIIDSISNINKELTSSEFLGSTNYERLVKKRTVYPWCKVSMYYNCPQDIIMTVFALGQIPHTLEKCTLFNEIS